MGKAIANGFPLSAVGASKQLFGEWPPGSHGTTFGGNPVSCAAAAATVEALQNVVPTVEKLSDHAFERFHDLAARHRTIGDVRGMGLMIGVELADEDRTPNPDALTFLRSYALEQGMFVLSCGPYLNVIRFIPPLVVSPEELDQGIDILDAGLSAFENQ